RGVVVRVAAPHALAVARAGTKRQDRVAERGARFGDSGEPAHALLALGAIRVGHVERAGDRRDLDAARRGGAGHARDVVPRPDVALDRDRDLEVAEGAARELHLDEPGAAAGALEVARADGDRIGAEVAGQVDQVAAVRGQEVAAPVGARIEVRAARTLAADR